MMKFRIQCSRNGCRLGLISDAGRHGNKTLETPMCMLYTKGASAPHLTIDMLQKIQRLPSIAHMPVNHLAEHQESLEAFKKGIGHFSALQDFLVYCSVQDPASEVSSGYNDKTGTAVWCRGGKLKLDVNQFIKVQEACQPDWYQALCDGDTNAESSRKRTGKAVDRTLRFLDDILGLHSISQRLQGVELFGTIEGGYNNHDRERSAKETAARPVAGFVVEGFHNFGPTAENFKISEINDTLTKMMICLPEDKPRVMQSVWRPDTVLEALELGIDIFDSSYPYIATERGCALVFVHDLKQSPEDLNGSTKLADGFEINLNDKKYFEDFSPVLKSCSCYTCQKFTRSYINHLLNTSELLAGVLLMIHNFHHYFEYFHSIRLSLAEDRYTDLKQLITMQKEDALS